MRARDLLRFALSALWQHKVRSLLTLGGVVAGAFLLVVSIAVGQGVEQTTVQQFRKYGRLRSVSVFPGFQPMEKILASGPLTGAGSDLMLGTQVPSNFTSKRCSALICRGLTCLP